MSSRVIPRLVRQRASEIGHSIGVGDRWDASVDPEREARRVLKLAAAVNEKEAAAPAAVVAPAVAQAVANNIDSAFPKTWTVATFQQVPWRVQINGRWWGRVLEWDMVAADPAAPPLRRLKQAKLKILFDKVGDDANLSVDERTTLGWSGKAAFGKHVAWVKA